MNKKLNIVIHLICQYYSLFFIIMDTPIVVNHTNFSHMAICDCQINIAFTYSGTNMLCYYQMELNDYLKFMGKFAYENEFRIDENLNTTFKIVPELLAATRILKNEINWKLTFIEDDLLINSPIFTTMEDSNGNMCLYTVDKSASEMKDIGERKITEVYESVLTYQNGEKMDGFEFSFEDKVAPFVSLNDVKKLKNNNYEYLPWLENLIETGLYMEFDFVEQKLADNKVICHFKPILKIKK